MKNTFVLTELEQMRAIADPLRVKIVRTMAEEPMTTSQVARKLGEKPNRLYYHVTELEKAGILEVAETRRKGNLLEKYYTPVARMFRIDPCIFQKGAEGQEVYLQTARSICDNTILDIRDAIDRGLLSPEEMDRAMNVNLDYFFSPEQAREFADEFRALVDRWSSMEEDNDGGRTTHLTLLLYTKGGGTDT